MRKNLQVGPIVLLSVSLLLPAIWLRSGIPIAYNESGFLFIANQHDAFERSRFVWVDALATGVSNARGISLVIFYGPNAILEALGFPAVVRQYLVFAAILASSGLGIFWAYRRLSETENSSQVWLPATAAALFYILNPYSLNLIWHRFTGSILGLPGPPLIILIVLSLRKKVTVPKIILAAIALTLLAVNAVNPAYVLPFALPGAVYIFLDGARARRHWSKLKNLGIGLTAVGVLVILLNTWWLIPLLHSLRQEYAIANSAMGLTSNDFLLSHKTGTTLLDSARLIDADFSRWRAVPYQPGAVESLIPLVGIMAVAIGRKRQINLLAGILLIIGLFAMKGLNAPGGNIFLWTFNQVPFFNSFRWPSEKFGIVVAFAYALLMGQMSAFIFAYALARQRYWRLLSTVGVVTALLLLGLGVWPMWTGDVFSQFAGWGSDSTPAGPDPHVVVPDYYFTAAKWLAIQPGIFRLFMVPQTYRDLLSYTWPHGYFGSDAGSVDWVLNRPTLEQSTGNDDVDSIRNTIVSDLESGQNTQAAKLIGLFNARYVFFRQDVDLGVSSDSAMTKLENQLKSTSELQVVNTFGKLTVYQVDSRYVLPRIYAAQTPLYLDVGYAQLDDDLRSQLAENVAQQQSKDVQIDFEQISPTEFRAKVRAPVAFWLVFNESYTSEWRASFEPSGPPASQAWFPFLTDLFGQTSQTEIGEHHLANGYANVWYVSRTGEFTIDLNYAAQRNLEIGSLVSGIAATVCLGYLIVLVAWKRRSD